MKPKIALIIAAAVIALAGLAASAAAPAAAPERPASPPAVGGRPAPTIAFDGNFVQGRTEAQRIASYRRLRAMGVTVIRLDFRWAAIERIGQPLHRYVWGALDREVHEIRAAGLKILGIIDYSNPNYSRAGWAAHERGQTASGPFGVGDPQYYPPDDPRTFARYAADVARRYHADVIGWEIWNEENGGWRFWEPKEDPVAYGNLLCAADRALKRVDAQTPVVFGGLFFPPLGGAIGTGAVRFLGEVLAQPGTRHCFDAIAYHPYPYPFTSPEAAVGDRGSVIGAVDQLRAVLRRDGLPRMPLWNTEVGWPTSPRGNGVTEARQARYVARLQLLSWARGVPLLTWYTWGDAADASGANQEAHFGFFRLDGSAKPAYHALVVLQRELGGPGWRFVADRSRALGLPRGHGGVDSGYALAFAASGGRHRLALWYADEHPPAGSNPFARVEPGTPARTITVRVPIGAHVTVRSLLGRRLAVPAGAVGVLRLVVGQDPLYVGWTTH